MVKTRSQNTSKRVRRAPVVEESEDEDFMDLQDALRLPRMDRLVIHNEKGLLQEELEPGDW